MARSARSDEDIKTDVLSLKNNFMRWYNVCHDKADMPVYWCNHDHPRVVSNMARPLPPMNRPRCSSPPCFSLYGTPFLYNGEEIGMSNATYAKAEDYFTDVGTKNDVLQCRKNGYTEEQILSYLHRCSRLNARTPMQWDEYASMPAFRRPSRSTPPIRITERASTSSMR
jgi:glycosidase